MTFETPQRRVLVVEDDADTRELLREFLRRAGFAVVEAGDGAAGLRQLYASRPDLVILDISLPRLDGWKTLERIRDLSDVPVLVLTAHSLELERVRALNSGADDYVTKPFGRQELLARIEALLRRRGERPDESDVYRDGMIEISFPQRRVRVRGTEVLLTPLEFRLLAVLVRHPNRVLSQEQLLELVWRENGVLGTEVKHYIGYLRRKLRPAGGDQAIETVRGFGYRYRVPV